MTYDLLIKNGRIIDGSGRPAFHGDVAVKKGTIVELGRVSGPARQVIEADGRAVAPGFIDNHCHYDAQVLWDPLCTYSCDHGATGRRLLQLDCAFKDKVGWSRQCHILEMFIVVAKIDA